MRTAKRRLLMMVSTGVMLLTFAGTAAADSPDIPAPVRHDWDGPANCGLLSPQVAFAGFAGPRRTFIPGPPTINSDGRSELRGNAVEGTIILETSNGGCGLAATIRVESKFCRSIGPFTDCGWREWGERAYTYDEIPTNGVRVFEPIRSAARTGTHTYRMAVEVSGTQLEAVDGLRGTRFRGALLPQRATIVLYGPEYRVAG